MPPKASTSGGGRGSKKLTPLEAKINKAGLAAPNGTITQTELLDKLGLTITSTTMEAINSMLRKVLMTMYTNGKGEISYKFMGKDSARTMGDMESDEKLIYDQIKDAGSKAIWTKSLTERTGLPRVNMTRALKALEGKKLVMSVKSVKNPTRKMYILVGIAPSVDITGGPWFTDNELDVEFIDQLKSQTEFFLNKRTSPAGNDKNRSNPGSASSSYPNASEIRKFLSKIITAVDLRDEHVADLLEVMVQDGTVRKIFVRKEQQEDDGEDEDGEGGKKRKREEDGDSDDDARGQGKKKAKKDSSSKRKSGSSKKDASKALAESRKKKKDKLRKMAESDSSSEGSGGATSESEDDFNSDEDAETAAARKAKKIVAGKKASTTKRKKRRGIKAGSDDESVSGGGGDTSESSQDSQAEDSSEDEDAKRRANPTSFGFDYVFRVVKPYKPLIGHTDMPCGTCPSASFCSEPAVAKVNRVTAGSLRLSQPRLALTDGDFSTFTPAQYPTLASLQGARNQMQGVGMLGGAGAAIGTSDEKWGEMIGRVGGGVAPVNPSDCHYMRDWLDF